MRDHGLFQAICRVNRLDGVDKEYGYVIDYKDLFRSLEGAIGDYTGEAFDGYDRADVAALLTNRLERGRKRLEETREAVKALCEPVEPPHDMAAYLRYFCDGHADAAEDASGGTEPRAPGRRGVGRGARRLTISRSSNIDWTLLQLTISRIASTATQRAARTREKGPSPSFRATPLASLRKPWPTPPPSSSWVRGRSGRRRWSRT